MFFIHQLVCFVILFAYALVVFELVFLHVPSVASVYQLLWSKKSIINHSNEKLLSGKLFEVLQWPMVKKLLLLAIPTFLSILAGLLPLFYIVAIITNMFSWDDLNNTTLFQNLVGIVLVIIGRVFTVYATLVIRKENAQVKDSFQLKTNDVFGLSRNPLLVGMYVMYLGMLCIFPNILFAVGLIIYATNMHFRILLEEDFLSFQFGQPFDTYKINVRRYL